MSKARVEEKIDEPSGESPAIQRRKVLYARDQAEFSKGSDKEEHYALRFVEEVSCFRV